jgi:hypothetical protein
LGGGDASYPVLGAVPDVQRDDQWRHAELNLHQLYRTLPYHPSMFVLGGLGFGDYGGVSMGKAYHFNLDNLGFIPVATGVSGLALKWAGTDASGVKAYSYHWSNQPAEEADTNPEGPQAEATFSNLAPGTLYFHIRGQDNAGNWGPTAHYKYLIDNELPKIALASQDAASRFLQLSASDNSSGIDVSALSAIINGKAFPLNPQHVDFNQVQGSLRWDWPADTGVCSGKIPDGYIYNFELPPFKDYAGNVSQPLKWVWKADYSKDKEPPYAPEVFAPAETVFSFDTFTSGVGSWRNWGGIYGSTVKRFFDPDRKDHCLQVVDDMTSGSGGVMINRTTYDAVKYPYLSFDYKIPAEAKIHFMLHVNGVWQGIALTVPSTYPHYTNIGTANIVADNKWHSASVNVLKLLKAALPGAAAYSIVYLAIADYYTYYTPAGVPYYIDNFSISGPGSANPTVECKSFDTSGIAQFRYLPAGNPVASTDKGSAVPDAKIAFPVLDPGLHHLHFSAADGPGNWGPASRLLYVVPWTLRTGKPPQKNTLLVRAWNCPEALWQTVRPETVPLDPDYYGIWRTPAELKDAAAWAFLPNCVPDWDIEQKGDRPNNVFLRWDGSVTFPQNGDWHIIAECNGMAGIAIDLNGDGKFTPDEFREARVPAKPAKLRTFKDVKANQSYGFIAILHKGAGPGHVARLSWSQDPAWNQVKDGQIDPTEKAPKAVIPESAFSYIP